MKYFLFVIENDDCWMIQLKMERGKKKSKINGPAFSYWFNFFITIYFQKNYWFIHWSKRPLISWLMIQSTIRSFPSSFSANFDSLDLQFNSNGFISSNLAFKMEIFVRLNSYLVLITVGLILPSRDLVTSRLAIFNRMVYGRTNV